MGQQIVFALRDSMHRVLIKLASFLPGLLALLVAVVILTAVGALLALILRRILTAVKFDERFARSQTVNVADWSPRHSPTVLVTRTVFWACVILGSSSASPPSTPPTPATRRLPPSSSPISLTRSARCSCCWPEPSSRASSPAPS